MSTDEFCSSWRVFLLEWELAKHYHYPYLLYMGRTNRNPLLDQLLPSLLFLRATSLLHEGLKLSIAIRELVLPKDKYKDSLHGRISFLDDEGILSNGKGLHDIRKRRNDIAHGSMSATTWDKLAQDVDKIETTLQQLEIVSARPHLEYYGERSAMQWLEDPKILGTRDFKCGVKENGKPAIEFSWTEKLYRSNGK